MTGFSSVNSVSPWLKIVVGLAYLRRSAFYSFSFAPL